MGFLDYHLGISIPVQNFNPGITVLKILDPGIPGLVSSQKWYQTVLIKVKTN